jgi:hypothetical protein
VVPGYRERRATRRIVNIATVRAGDLVWHTGAPSIITVERL